MCPSANTACCREKRLDGCYECEELIQCGKGFYANGKDVNAIKAAEDSINAVPSAYIPKSALKKALGGIRNGDIILFTTTVDGLDVSHCAIAKVDAGKPVRFIHASTGAMKVILEPRTLEEYVTGRKAVTGIQVYRVR